MPNTAMEATELLKEIQKHDSQQAFRSLYDMYYDRFFRIAFYYLQRDEWAQEVILDVFTTLWNHRKRNTELKLRKYIGTDDCQYS